MTIPKVFISYSWSVSDKVLELAERLVVNGVDVILDKWDLKEGQDKYAFMEQSVNNSDVNRVIIASDKSYADKANSRSGGVGDEAAIISPEIYGKSAQEKFVPVILETDNDNKPYLPTFIKSRIYIDLSNDDNYEAEYEKLLRNLYGKPEYSKPKLGNTPEWLNEETTDFSAIRDVIKQLKNDNNNSNKSDFLARKAVDTFAVALKSLGLPLDKPIDGDLLLKRIDASKPLRDLLIDYVEALVSKDLAVGETMGNFFERFYNDLMDTREVKPCYPQNLEFYYYFIWEAFICTSATLLHYEKYAELNKLLFRTYFLDNRDGRGEYACSYVEFRHPFEVIEGLCKPESDRSNLITLAGDIAIKREKRPIITKDSIIDSDLILYQLSSLTNANWKWFPILYIYKYQHYQRSQSIWTRLQSKTYCKKIMLLFGVKSIDALKEQISKCEYDKDYRHQSSGAAAPNILNSIKVDEIGILS
jgi:hypothetical protein